MGGEGAVLGCHLCISSPPSSLSMHMFFGICKRVGKLILLRDLQVAAGSLTLLFLGSTVIVAYIAWCSGKSRIRGIYNNCKMSGNPACILGSRVRVSGRAGAVWSNLLVGGLPAAVILVILVTLILFSFGM